jgi:hypothetical protein
MTKFAKIIEVDGEQVLYYLGPDDEDDDREVLHVLASIEGVWVNTSASITCKVAETVLDSYTKGKARKFLTEMRELLAPVLEPS